MRILLINPNTTQAVTDLVTRHARAIAGDAADILPVTGRFGARYISSRAAAAIAGHAALDAFATHGDGCDAVYLACFGDPGLWALREIASVPVVGMAEAACRQAARRGRFAIVTGGALWKPMLEEFVAMIGLGDRLAAVRTIAPTGGQIAQNPDTAIAALTAACEACVGDDGAEIVILGGAALAGLAHGIQPSIPVPLVCSVEAGTRAVIEAARDPHTRQAERPASESVGLSPELAALLNGRSRLP